MSMIEKGPGGRATIDDVATEAGVHSSTVSRAINRPDLVNDETRVRVLDAVERLRYVPNRSAQGLASGRTASIGVVVPDITNPFFALVVRGATAAAHDVEHVVLLGDAEQSDEAEQRLIESLSRQVDGLIVCAPGDHYSDSLRAAPGLPVVFVNREVPDLPSVLVDQARIVTEVAEHLAALGHRRIAWIDGPSRNWSAGRRRAVVLDWAAARDDVEVAVLPSSEPTFEGGVSVVGSVLDAGATAVAAFNDVLALGVMAGLRECGVDVPNEVSVVGSDDIPLAGMSDPPLTTMATPCREVGVRAVDILMRLIDDPRARIEAAESIEPKLIDRGSTAAPGR